MKEKHFIISVAENLVFVGSEGQINRNSNGSQWIDVKLVNWNLNEGEVLYITFEHCDEETELITRVGPLHLFYNSALRRYVTEAPPELVSLSGEWKCSLELRFDLTDKLENPLTTIVTVIDSEGNVISETAIRKSGDDYLTYNSITSCVGTLTVADSVVNPVTGNNFKETELISAAKTIANNSTAALEAADKAKEYAVEAGQQADRSEANANLSQAAAEEAQAAAKLASSKAVVIWGFNEAVDISDLDWEVK